MGATSAIEWTDATWNPWYGCLKVSPGCKQCYMFRDQKRYGRDPDGQTLDTIAADYGLTRERVRQIESRALEKIRININNGRLQIRASKSVRLRVIQGGGE